MHTRAHTWRLGVSRAPVWCPRVPMGLCQLHPPALMQSPGPGGGLHHPGAQWSAQMWANRQRVCTRGCTPGTVPGPGLCWALILYLPEQLFTAPSPLPHPSPLVLSEPTGALAGSVPTPTRTRTQDKDGCGVGLSGSAPQTRAAAARGGACCGQPAQGGKGSFLGAWGRQGRSAESPEPSRPRPGGSRSCGQLASAAWCGDMARVCTRPHIRGYAWRGDTAQDTDTHTAPGSSAGGGAREVGFGVGTPQQGHTQA